jgi:hypothetical protein
MAKRSKLKVLPKVASKPVSDSARLLYNDVMGPMLAAVNALNQCAGQLQNSIATRIATLDDVNIDDGWKLDVDKMRWVQLPTTREQANVGTGE